MMLFLWIESEGSLVVLVCFGDKATSAGAADW